MTGGELRRRPRPLARALGCGALLGASYAFPLFVTNFVVFVPVLIWLVRHGHERGAPVWRTAFLFGLGTHLVTLHWISELASWTWLAWLLYGLFAVLLAARIMLSLRLLEWLHRRTGWPLALLLPAVWVPLEWLQAFGDLRMTGDHVAHTLSRYPFVVQFADLFGPYGVAAWMLAINGGLADLWLARGRPVRRRIAVGLAGLIGLVLVYDAARWFTPVEPTGALTVGLIQPNVPLEQKREGVDLARRGGQLIELTRQAALAGAEVVVWPETARSGSLQEWLDRPETRVMAEVSAMAKALDVSLVVGTEYYRIRSQEDYDFYNAAVAVDRNGELSDEWTAKRYLVPFVERMPFQSVLKPLLRGKSGEWEWLMGGFEIGPQTLLPVENTKVGVLVCYEQLFADLARRLNRKGATWLLEITNDAWFGRSLFQPYQANALRLRAIENRRDIVRVANTGISGFVDRRGLYRHRTELFVEAVEVAEISTYEGRTLFNRVGNVAAWALALACLGAIIRARGSDATGATRDLGDSLAGRRT